jgi:hypothetical protein
MEERKEWGWMREVGLQERVERGGKEWGTEAEGRCGDDGMGCSV